jgi:polyisoprenyl-teichoic acid--peptidoglycan teichoic acid transferase
VSVASPIRNPDVDSPAVMTKRAWWLIALNFLIPGSAQVLAGDRRLGRFGLGATLVLWGLVTIAVATYLLAQPVFVTVATNFFSLWIVQAVLIFYAALWIVLTLDTLRLARLIRLTSGSRVVIAGLTVAALVVVGGGAAYGVMVAGVTRSTVDAVFSGGQIEEPIDGRYNILLLGGDAGPDREGLRPDSISVVSIDATTGESTIFGIPRNLEYVPFAAESPLAASYPNGYGSDGCGVDVCFINSIYTEVELFTPEYYPDAVSAGSRPGIEAMRDAAEGVLGLTIQYYVLIDMQGFAELIDALGGVDISVTSRYPIGGGEDENGNPVDVEGWIEPGVQRMDGRIALWYARSRHGTSDYDRMARQREVQEAMLRQFDPSNVLSKFQSVAEAGAQIISTDIPQPMLGRFVELASLAREHPIVDVELVPETGVDPADPDYPFVRELVIAATAPAEIVEE